MNKLTLILGMILCFQFAEAQKSNTPKGYKHTKSGIDYKIVKDVKGKKTANKTDMLVMHMVWKAKDSVYFDSRKIYSGEAFPYEITDAAFPGDPVEILKMLTAGDSAVILVPVDSFKKSGQKVPVGNGEYSMMEFNISVVDVKTQKELKEEIEVQKIKDDSLIRNYLQEHNIVATKTASGLYYRIETPGIGPNIRRGQVARVLQVGMTLDENVFDANMGPKAANNNILDIVVGKKSVLPAWNEGLLLLKEGSIATFYIPSHLAFGKTKKDKVPANSVIITQVAVKEVKDDVQSK